MIVEALARRLIKGNELRRRLVPRDHADASRDVPFVEVVEGCTIDKWLAQGGKAAITLGRIVILRDGRTNPRRIKHELVHVAQWERYGDSFVFRYLLNPSKWEAPAEEAEKA